MRIVGVRLKCIIIIIIIEYMSVKKSADYFRILRKRKLPVT